MGWVSPGNRHHTHNGRGQRGPGGAGQRSASPHLLPTTPEPAAHRALVRGWGTLTPSWGWRTLTPFWGWGTLTPTWGWRTLTLSWGFRTSYRGWGWGMGPWTGLGPTLHPALGDTKAPLPWRSSADPNLDVGSPLDRSSLPKSSGRASCHTLLLLEKKVTVSTPPHPTRPCWRCPGMGFLVPSGTRGGFVLRFTAGGHVSEKRREIPLLPRGWQQELQVT